MRCQWISIFISYHSKWRILDANLMTNIRASFCGILLSWKKLRLKSWAIPGTKKLLFNFHAHQFFSLFNKFDEFYAYFSLGRWDEVADPVCLINSFLFHSWSVNNLPSDLTITVLFLWCWRSIWSYTLHYLCHHLDLTYFFQKLMAKFTIW